MVVRKALSSTIIQLCRVHRISGEIQRIDCRPSRGPVAGDLLSSLATELRLALGLGLCHLTQSSSTRAGGVRLWLHSGPAQSSALGEIGRGT